MNYHKLLFKQISRHLPEELLENPAIVKFLTVVNDSYIALERDTELAERAFHISEEQYIDLNKKLKHELDVKKRSVDKLKQAVGIFIGNNEEQDNDDLLMIAQYLHDEVSKRKKSEAALKTSEQMWKFALEGTGDGVWEYHLQKGEAFFSKQYKRILGYGGNEFKNDSGEWYAHVHPDDLEMIRKTEQDYADGKILNHKREFRLRHKDGHYVWILDRGMVVGYTEDGKPERMVGTHTDITERKLSEQALKLNEEKYRSILANMNLGLLEVDNNEIVKYANASFCKMSGYAEEELLHKKASNVLILPESTKNLVKIKNNLRKKGVSDSYEILITNKKGEARWWLVSGAPRYDDNNQLVGSIGIHLDITNQKQLELDLIKARDEARASTQAKEMFLANMSHEIRTPMSAILGMAKQLQKTRLNKEQLFFLGTIHSAADNLMVIINDILDLTKIDSGKLSLENIGFEPHLVVERVMQVMMHKAEEKGIGLTNSFCDPNLPVVLIGDPFRLNQILLNLVSNSIKFTAKGSVDISLKVQSDDGEYQKLKITVSDTGIGMDAEFISRISEKFIQEDDSITRKYGGTGLGMSISTELIELMGGNLQISSTKNVGTVISFDVELKKGDVKDLPQKENIEMDTSLLAGKKILVTDDNEINRLLATTILQSYGVEIQEAEDGAQAIEKIKTTVFDLILMDVQMPTMDGLEATKIIRKKLSIKTPIIALTAFAIKGDHKKCLEAGVNDYLSKPFEENDLLAMVSRWLLKRTENMVKTKVLPPIKKRALFSLSKLHEISHDNDEFIQKMKTLFIKQAISTIQEMKAAYEANDYQLLSKLAHRMKPSIDTMDIVSLKAPIREIELSDKDMNPGKEKRMKALLSNLDRTINAVVIQLNKT